MVPSMGGDVQISEGSAGGSGGGSKSLTHILKLIDYTEPPRPKTGESGDGAA